MQACTSLQTDNHASIPPLSFLHAGCPSCCPTNSIKALKAMPTYQANVNFPRSIVVCRSCQGIVNQLGKCIRCTTSKTVVEKQPWCWCQSKKVQQEAVNNTSATAQQSPKLISDIISFNSA